MNKRRGKREGSESRYTEEKDKGDEGKEDVKGGRSGGGEKGGDEEGKVRQVKKGK